MKLIQNTNRSISILYEIDLLTFCISSAAIVKIPKPLYQNKTGTQKRDTQLFFIFRPVLIKLSFYLEFKIKFIQQLLKIALEATFVTIPSRSQSPATHLPRLEYLYAPFCTISCILGSSLLQPSCFFVCIFSAFESVIRPCWQSLANEFSIP